MKMNLISAMSIVKWLLDNYDNLVIQNNAQRPHNLSSVLSHSWYTYMEEGV